MRPFVRVLLLAAGCAVMLATSYRPPGAFTYQPIQLPAGGSETVELSMMGSEGRPFASTTYIRTWSRSGRLVGILSPTAPPAEALTTLAPSASYVVGEQLEGLGTVAFVLYSPQEELFDKDRGQPPLLPAPGTAFLTLYAPDGPMDAQLAFDMRAMQFQCDCRVEVKTNSVHRWPPRAQQEGTDGGSGN
jgi:hypothetical protein